MQSRARGLTRAILDTFPVVKFGGAPPPTETAGKDIETVQTGSSSPAMELSPIASPKVQTPIEPHQPPADLPTAGATSALPTTDDRATCPICIVEFEDGDDLRELPCEGNHRFHQECVDPWLLELSSSCPICRHGMHFVLPFLN